MIPVQYPLCADCRFGPQAVREYYGAKAQNPNMYARHPCGQCGRNIPAQYPLCTDCRFGGGGQGAQGAGRGGGPGMMNQFGGPQGGGPWQQQGAQGFGGPGGYGGPNQGRGFQPQPHNQQYGGQAAQYGQQPAAQPAAQQYGQQPGYVAQQQAAAAPATNLDPTGKPLPAGWSTAADPASGRTYYINNAALTSQWEVPTAPAQPAAAQPTA